MNSFHQSVTHPRGAIPASYCSLSGTLSRKEDGENKVGRKRKRNFITKILLFDTLYLISDI